MRATVNSKIAQSIQPFFSLVSGIVLRYLVFCVFLRIVASGAVFRWEMNEAIQNGRAGREKLSWSLRVSRLRSKLSVEKEKVCMYKY